MVLSNEMLWKILGIGGKFSGEKYGPNDCRQNSRTFGPVNVDWLEAKKLVVESSMK